MNNSWQLRQYGTKTDNIDPNRKCNTLWVGDLETTVDEKYLNNIFGQEFTIQSIHVYKDKITNGKVSQLKYLIFQVNYAFIVFETSDMAEEALKRYNGKDKPLYNRPFKINWGSSKKSVTQGNTKETPTADVVPVSMRSTLNNFITPNALNLLSQQNNHLSEEQQLKAATLKALGLSQSVEYQHTPSNNTEAPIIPQTSSNFEINPETYNSENPTSIYVGDLDQKCDNIYLEEIFKSRYQTVVGVKIIKDATTRNSKGFGFVMFASPEEAEKSIKEMNGFQILTRKIRTGKSLNKTTNVMGANGQTIIGQPNMQTQMGSYMGGMPMQQQVYQQGPQQRVHKPPLQSMNHMSQYMNNMYSMINQNPSNPAQSTLYSQLYPNQPNNNGQNMNPAQNYYQINPLSAMNYGFLYDPSLLQMMNMNNQMAQPNAQTNQKNLNKIEEEEDNKLDDDDEEEEEINQEEKERLEREQAEQNKFHIEELLGKRASMLKKKIENEKKQDNGIVTPYDVSEESDIERVKFRKKANLFDQLKKNKTAEEELKEMMTSSLDSTSSSEHYCNKFIIQMFDS